ncbi:MAG: SDR family oxidoreductase [Pseudomonadaceae bacterium]|nr:SDR family oxidoreductase [Pseudomonadaceae bacterium]
MSQPFALTGKTAIVSAAGRGIGRGIAIALANAGANVVVNSWSPDKVADTVAACEAAGAKALGFPGDITEPDVMLACLEAGENAFGDIDILVNNVGAGPKTATEPPPGPLGPIAALWDAMFEQNLKPAVLFSEAVSARMKKQGSGRIINISSIAGKRGMSPEMLTVFAPAAYGAMKAALSHYTQNLAEQLGQHGITANAVCPGIVWTDAWLGNAERAVTHLPQFKGQDPRQWFEGIAEGKYPEIFDRTPTGKEQSVEDIGNAVVFLASDAASSITGQNLMVDGGMVML